MNAVTQTVAAEPVSGVELFVPLAKLKKSPRNARKVPPGEAAIEALAAPSAQANQDFPTPVGPQITRLSWAAIQSPATSLYRA